MSQREHAEDPIWWSIKNATDFDVHRRTVVLFHPSPALPNPMIWVDNTGQVWPELRQILEGLDPQGIAVNTDRNIALSGGLHVGELGDLIDNLGEKWMNRTVNIPMLAIEYVATKIDDQLKYYRDLQELTWAMIEEGFSSRVIDPGTTTTQDVEWWFREKIQEQNLTTWNHPGVSVITPESFPGWEGTEDVIQPGDLLHIDWGQ